MAVLEVLELMTRFNKSREEASAKAVAISAETVKGIKSAWVKDQRA